MNRKEQKARRKQIALTVAAGRRLAATAAKFNVSTVHVRTCCREFRVKICKR